MTVWKFELAVASACEVLIPKGWRPLAVQMQDETPCLWALVDPAAESEPVGIVCYGTGHPVMNAEQLDYLGTIQIAGGEFIFHYFAVKRAA